jgi:hypothetical protein
MTPYCTELCDEVVTASKTSHPVTMTPYCTELCDEVVTASTTHAQHMHILLACCADEPYEAYAARRIAQYEDELRAKQRDCKDIGDQVTLAILCCRYL